VIIFCAYFDICIEGLEATQPERKKEVGEFIVWEDIRILRNTTNEDIYAHSTNKNTASIKLHDSIGSVSSCGNF